MAYSELIKDFERIREYMRQFYIYGLKTRDEYDAKSARSYDNERRRIESWLGEYMSFRQDTAGKVSFISVDSQEILHNPLYNAFKAKSFTANDIVLHFFIMDILEEHEECTVTEIADFISLEYLAEFEDPKELDESTIRKKLKEYEKIGLVSSKKQGKKLVFSKTKNKVNIDEWKDAVAFFSELDPLGVIGSFLLDKIDDIPDYFQFKHHYILHVLESEIMYALLSCISDDRTAHIEMFSRRKEKIVEYEILPLKIMISTQNGRSYVFALSMRDRKFNMYRLDNIKKVRSGKIAADKPQIIEDGEKFLKHEWYVSNGNEKSLEHLEMVLRINPWAEHILKRLEREGGKGTVEKTGENTYKFSIDVYDTSEMRPWLRTFIGRIVSLSCSNKDTEKVFFEDLEAMYELYGGDDSAV